MDGIAVLDPAPAGLISGEKSMVLKLLAVENETLLVRMETLEFRRQLKISREEEMGLRSDIRTRPQTGRPF